MITSATRAEEIKIQMKGKRNVARESLFNEDRYIKKTTLKIMTNS